MEHEIKPSFRSQNSLWPLALLGILVSGLALFTSKSNKSCNPVHPQDGPGNKDTHAQTQSVLTANIVPTRPNSDSAKGSKNRTPLWEKFAVLIALGLLIVNICQMRSTEKAARAAETANKNAQSALVITEQANVTIGRPDGTVADILWPKEPKGKAGLMIYFQNSGHLPAKFNWGNSSPMIALLPANPSALKEDQMGSQWSDFKTDHFFQPMWRAKRKDGGFQWSGTVLIAGNSSYQGILWEIPRERMLQLMQWDRPFVPDGKFEYCDGFGKHVCKRFSISYSRDPYNRFFLASEEECAVWEMQVLNPDPSLQYLPPCEVSEHREELQGSLRNSPKP